MAGVDTDMKLVIDYKAKRLVVYIDDPNAVRWGKENVQQAQTIDMTKPAVRQAKVDARAMKGKQGRGKRTPALNSMKEWTDRYYSTLTTMRREGYTYRAIAKELARSIKAVQGKMYLINGSGRK